MPIHDDHLNELTPTDLKPIKPSQQLNLPHPPDRLASNPQAEV